VGLGQSIQKYAYLPENTTDSIFAIYAEETGFIGSIILLGIYIVQLLIGCLIAIKVKDKFGKLLACGIITFLGVQALVNLASQVVLIPLTGVPLPFISYGGSSMIINFIGLGIMLSIARTISKK
jgi:cell division protein FtsW